MRLANVLGCPPSALSPPPAPTVNATTTNSQQDRCEYMRAAQAKMSVGGMECFTYVAPSVVDPTTRMQL
jgi:hypothetical protein